MLSALVAAYDQHRRWMMADKFAALQRAVDHARDVLAQPETASAVEAAIAAGQPVTLPSGTVIADPAWLESLITIRTADPLKRQALRPIPVSERLPGPEDCGISAGGYFQSSCWCWNPPSSLGGIGWWSIEPLEWCEGATHWLPAHALPLPEFDHE